jgi:hypothetical protein
MVVIRREQMRVFEQAVVKEFELRLAAHIAEAFPKHAEAMGDEARLNTARRARERAAAHGIKGEGNTERYLDLMLMFGSAFDEDPQLAWAARALVNSASKDETARIDALYAAAADYAARVSGPGNQFLDRALKMLPKQRLDGFAASGARSYEEYILRRLAATYREKAEAAGLEPLREIVRRAVDAARRYGLTTEGGVTLLVLLMFFLGAGFDADPQFPWASAVLNDQSLKEPVKKIEQLYEAAMNVLRQFAA